MATLSTAAWVGHNLAIATDLGGGLFGKLALEPAVRKVESRGERGEVLNDAWMRYNVGNLASLYVLGGTWLAGRLFLSGWQSGKDTRKLVIAKDILVGGAVATGITCAALGYTLDKKTERDPKLITAVNAIGWGHLALIAGVGAITTALAMKSGKSVTWSFFSKLLP
jgi:hypothetical protein